MIAECGQIKEVTLMWKKRNDFNDSERSPHRRVFLTAFLVFFAAGSLFAQTGVDPNEVSGNIAGERYARWNNGVIEPTGAHKQGGIIWDNGAVTGWWSGTELGYVNLDWGRMPSSSQMLPDHAVDGFVFKYATNNTVSPGEDFGVYFFDSCSGWGNLGIQEAGFTLTGLPNGAGLPTLPPGYAWIWSMNMDLEGSGYEFLLGYEMGIGLSRLNTPLYGATGLVIGDRPNAGGNGPTGTEDAYDIYYPNGTYNGTWWFGSSFWSTWAFQLYGSEGVGTNMVAYGQGAQGNDAYLYGLGTFEQGETVHFMLRKGGQDLQGNLGVSLSSRYLYYGGSYDVTRLIGGFTAGSPLVMNQPDVGDFCTYDVDLPSNLPANLDIYFQGILSDPPILTPPVDASNGIKGTTPPGPPPPDYWFEQDKVWASDYAADREFGYDVDIDGIYAIVGQTDENGSYAGAAYVFQRSGTSWNQVAKLTSTGSMTGDMFGKSVAINDDYAIVGAPTHYSVGGNGAAYVFEKPGGGWSNMASETQKLTASDGAPSDYFGCSVDVDGNVAVIGAEGDDHPQGSWGAGAAYIFERGGSSWSEKSKLIASDRDPLEADSLGNSVAISGQYVIAGNYCDDDFGIEAGAAYIFEEPGGGWHAGQTLTETAKVTASGMGASSWDEFGFSVAIDGTQAVVGAPWDDFSGNDYAGSVYIFERVIGSWTLTPTAKLTASDHVYPANLGCSVSISGDWVAAGAYKDDDLGTWTGSAYFFKKPAGGWATATETDKRTASDGTGGDQFGFSVSIDGDYTIVGARMDADPPNGTSSPDDAGSAYIFILDE